MEKAELQQNMRRLMSFPQFRFVKLLTKEKQPKLFPLDTLLQEKSVIRDSDGKIQAGSFGKT